MTRLATSFVLGFHGCDRAVARRAVNGETKILESARDFDWLGPGSYFWESDQLRAIEWARWKATRGEYANPAVIGAVIDLGNCLDLVTREDQELLKKAFESFCQVQEAAGLPLPENKSAPGGGPDADRLLRYLDCAVIRHFHSIVEGSGGAAGKYDTVRGMFTEGATLYPGSGFREKSHVQIAVRNPQCIKGLFLPPPA